MGQLLLLTIGALVVGAIGFGIAVLISGSDPGLKPVEPEGRAVPLPANRPLLESDLGSTRFDTVLRGYRMAQVDIALGRAAYDIGYKQELIGVLEAEVEALRDGRLEDADKLRAAREAALSAIAGGAPALAGRARTDAPAADAGPAEASDAGSAKPNAVPDAAADADADAVEAGAVEADAVEAGARAAEGPSYRPQGMKLS